MNFTIHEVDQKTPAWLALRAGLVTGSCAGAILAERKKGTGELKVRGDLRQRLVCERLTKRSLEKQVRSDSLAHGNQTEPDAVAAYEAATGRIVQRVGFITHNDIKAGCSPDGFIGEWVGLIEAKCPTSQVHLEYLRAKEIPEEYKGQLLHTLFVTGAAWVDFVSFDPRFEDPAMQLFIRRLRREDCDLTAYYLALTLFLSEVDKAVEEARQLVQVAA